MASFGRFEPHTQPADAPRHPELTSHHIRATVDAVSSARHNFCGLCEPPARQEGPTQPRSHQVVVVVVAAVAGTEDSIAGQMRYAADCPHVWRTVTL
jgi:hypothetical protein